jgi:hypothetical protein
MAPIKKESDVEFKYDVGTMVKRYFSGHGWFSGAVVDRRSVKRSGVLLYSILYEDNDREELDEESLGKYVVDDGDKKKETSKRRSTRVKEVKRDEENPPQRTPSSEGPSKRRKTSIASNTTSTTSRGVTPSPISTTTAATPTTPQSAPTATSKHFAKKDSTAEDTSSSSEQEDEDEDEKLEDAWNVPVTLVKKKRTKVTGRNFQTVTKNASATKTATPVSKTKATAKNTDKKKGVNKKVPTTKKAARSSKATQPLPAVENEQPSAHLILAEIDSDDEKDRPFRVEYAVSSRATCRSCDERIQKGDIRVCSCPLFRGKPGFVVYRHLQCQLLPEEIQSVEDVGGWRRLKAEDRELLAKQVQNSKAQMERENEELHADELVQTKFQGELREAPPGLSATLLPFQQEGVSWMYNQEVNTGMVKGGILAGEYYDI